MEQYLIQTDNMSVGYEKKVLISGIDLKLHRGEIITLIGPNGSGKSTILKSIIRQLKLIAGTVYLDGQQMQKMSGKQVATRLAVLMTQKLQPELMTCYDVVSTGRYPYTGRLGILSEQDKQIIEQSLQLVDAMDIAQRDFNRISDGQRQRILLARAVCQQPEIIILDEPTSFLDMKHKLELLSILKRMVREQNIGVIMSLHELDLAQKISDTVVCVHGDKIERVGTPEQVFTADYMAHLYSMHNGSYHPLFGSIELPAPEGKPKVFVIGGNGTGIPVYRQLQKRGIPFAVGILAENDVDTPIARTLAAQVIIERAFEPFSEQTYQQARQSMEQCEQVICTLEAFGTVNEPCRWLMQLAKERNTLTDVQELYQL